MLDEIRELGFEFAELSHGIRISLLPGIFDAVDSGEIRISSLHNFCPLPMGIERAAPNVFKFTSGNPREREHALRHTLKTLDTAIRVKAPLVVLHLGAVDMKNYTDKLVDMVAAGKHDTPKYAKICQETLSKRDQKKVKFVENAHEVLRKIVETAEPLNIKLGVENREALEEIPFDNDFQALFSEFTSPSLVYWHDIGHAQIKENLGFINHRQHLESMSEKLYGFHVHDVEFPGRDHQAPGAGMVDFAGLAPLVKPGHLKVFEFSPSMTPAEAKRGVEHVKQLWGPE